MEINNICACSVQEATDRTKNLRGAGVSALEVFLPMPSWAWTLFLRRDNMLGRGLFVFLCWAALAQAQTTAFCSAYTGRDFVYDLLVPSGTMGDGGKIQTMNVGKVPALAGEGIAYALHTIKPCGSISCRIHSHSSFPQPSRFGTDRPFSIFWFWCQSTLCTPIPVQRSCST